MNWADDAQEFDPLLRGAVSLPPVIGEGCLARFDPDSLNEESGTDFSAAAGLRSMTSEPD
ncbi:hypothetical protein HG264_07520 [Pseudomonas sp. gcc21]|uniref:hypothetical protein n=1 Tax=Pseudomonas sp. gcc21 TaxID=2726989 RepID=UPI0014527A64|nr:hypothetical protein [Pseudomonas sp. gcc21]QJD58767.1 hypothetical protein HG264_07520 [Pseudomonas sp. gcc21]